MKLREYQVELIDKARDALRTNRSVLLQGPTGMGKTALTVFMMAEAEKRGKSSIFLVHQKELLQQTSRALWNQNLHHGIIASGKSASKLPAQVASLQTLVKRMDRVSEPSLLIIDEAHRAAAESYTRIISAWPNCKIIGLTATPKRTDGKPLDISFDSLVMGPGVRELINDGYLSEFEIYSPPTEFNTVKLSSKMGDFDLKETEKRIDKPSITGDAVSHYKRISYGKSCVVMCVSIDHAEHVSKQYNDENISAAVIHGKLSILERERILKDFSMGKYSIVCSVQLLLEGVDIPRIEVIQWLRPTKSLVIWMQGNGRGLRPSQGKTHLTILDHVGNFNRHGMPDKVREWTLSCDAKIAAKSSDEEESEVDNIKVKQCVKCYAVFNSGPARCPYCGADLPVFTRELEVQDGELEKIKAADDADHGRKMAAERGAARTLESLIELGIRKGMKRPAEWAAFTSAAREGRRATPADFSKAKKEHKRILSDGQRNENTETDTGSVF